MRIRGTSAAWAIAALMLATLAPSAGAAEPTVSCPYPLGQAAVSGENVLLGGGTDPEFQILDATLVEGGNQVQGTLFVSNGRMGVTQEMKVEFGSSTNDTDMVMLRWFEDDKGWNGTPVWLSSIDPTQKIPDSPPGYTAFHSHLASTMWRDEVWTIWEGWHSLWAPENQVMLLRGASPGWVSPMFVASEVSGGYDSAKYGAIAPMGDRLLVVYVVKDYPATLNEFDVVWRMFDGENFTAVQPLSAAGDGWSEVRPLLVADGGRVYAVWGAQSFDTNSYVIRWAVFDGQAWSAPRLLVETGATGPSDYWPAAFQGKLWVTFATNDPYLVNGDDLEVALISVDPTNGAPSSPLLVNPQPSHADDTNPTTLAASGKLWIGWVTVDPSYSHHQPVNDTDAVYRTFDGASFGPTTELSDADDNATDGVPNFFESSGSVYAYWGIGKFPPPAGLKHDYRQAVQLLERAASPLSGSSAVVGVEEASANGSTRVWVALQVPGGGPEVAPMVVAADGAFVPMERSGNQWTALLSGAQVGTGEPLVSLCGKVIATTRDDTIVPEGTGVTETTPLGGAAAAGAVLAAAALSVAFSVRPRRGTEDNGRKNPGPKD